MPSATVHLSQESAAAAIFVSVQKRVVITNKYMCLIQPRPFWVTKEKSSGSTGTGGFGIASVDEFFLVVGVGGRVFGPLVVLKWSRTRCV